MPSTSIPASMLEKFTTFGDLLRFLRRRAGLTQLELSIAVGYSDAQISRLEQNLRLPDIPTLEARFVPALDLADEPKALARLLDLAANVHREDAPGLGLCPFKGLQFFDETDADLFAGRESLTEKLVDRVFSLASTSGMGQDRFLAIVGASGSGKSSLVRAGLVPALHWDKASANWPIHVFTPTAHPLESLAASLTQDAGSVVATATLMDDLRRDSRSLNLSVKRILKRTGAERFLLVVDQFEELFALCRAEAERAAFIDNLLVAASCADGQALVVITLRADFYAYCSEYPQLRKALARQQEYIGAMSGEELRRAIEEPARRGRWELEPGLVELLLREVGKEPGALPLLSHALLETWQRRRGRTLTLSGYAASGGVRGAIAETAEAVFADQFTRTQQTIARRIFLRLTELGDETATGDTRRRASYAELILNPEEAAATQSVLKALADARLITTSQDSAEVAHEALIREWPKLRGWLDDNREGLRLHRHLAEAAREWAALGCEPDGLYRGARLAQAREWAASHTGDMNMLEYEFLQASNAWAEHEAVEREQQRQRELAAAQKLAEAEKQRAELESQRAEEQARTAARLRTRALYLAGASLLALAMAITALFFGSQARQAATTAQNQQRIAFSRELAAAAISNLENDPERSILLAMQAVTETYAIDQTWTLEAEDALRRALQASRVQLTLHGHQGRIWDIAFSPDGRRLASISDDGTARAWDAATGEGLLTFQTGNTHGYASIAFSPDGSRLAAPGQVGTARIYNASTGEVLITLRGHSDWVTGIAFSPDGERLATGSEDRTVKVWDAASGQEQLTLLGHTAEVWAVEFSPDGRQIATASDDGSAKVWDAATGEKQFTLSSPSSPVISVTYSPDGARLATGSFDGMARIWDAANGELLLAIRGHTSGIVGVAFSPEGARLATAGIDGRAKVWDAITGQELFTLSGHTDQVTGVVFSPDCDRTPGAPVEGCGTRLATSSWDGTLKVWNAAFNRELLTLSVSGASLAKLSLDGTRLAAGDGDGKIKLWDLSTALVDAARGVTADWTPATEISIFDDQAGAVSGIAFAQDGRLLAATGDNHTAQVWDLETGKRWPPVRGQTALVAPLALSPDGTHFVTASSDYTLKVWDFTTGQAQKTLPTTTSPTAAAFSPDGTLLAAGLADGTAKIWDAANGAERYVLHGHIEAIYSITFSPDGKRLATASDDGTAKVWDMATGRELLTLAGHTGWVNDVAFSPDGAHLATAGQDGTVRLWNAATGELTLYLPSIGSPVTSVAFSPDRSRLSTVSDSGLVRFYLLRIEDLVALAHRRVTRPLEAAECQQFLHLPLDRCPGAPETVTQASPPAITPSPHSGEAAAQGKVCELTDTTGVHDQLYNQIAFYGLQQAGERFRWEVATWEPQEPAEIQKNLTEILQSGCDLIVAPTSFNFPETLITSAEAYPDQKFQIMDWGVDQQRDNVWRQTFAVDQAGFLAGYLAASVTQTGKVGTFGGANFPGVTSFMDGFALGVNFYNQRNGAQIQVLGWDVEKRDGLFTGNFYSTEDGRRMGERLMDAGADIILPVAGNVGLGTALAVKTRGGAYLIGVDSDWALTYPEYAAIILTSIEKRMDVSVMLAVQAIENGTFTGGTHAGTLENGAVSIAPFHNLDHLVSPQVKADLGQIRRDIIAGKLKTGP